MALETVDEEQRNTGAISLTGNILKVSEADHYRHCFMLV
jgi:hypothetical protein